MVFACDAFSVDVSELLTFLETARDELGCQAVALRCDCANLETVYVMERSGELEVTDRGETFQYLDHSGDEAYAPIDFERARAICGQHGVRVDDRDPGHYPVVICVVRGAPLRAAIDAVSAAIDDLFSVAMRRTQDPTE